VGFIIFYTIKHTILLSSDPFTRGYYSFSIILFLTIGLNIFYVFSKGTKNFAHFQEEVYDVKWVIPTSWGFGLVCGLLWVYPFGPMAKKTLERRKLAKEQEQAATRSSDEAIEQENKAIDPDVDEYIPEPSAKPAVVSFHDTIATDPSEENLQDVKPKSFTSKLAAATFNQGKIARLL
jgi:recombinational DNA repair protein RecT